MTDDRLLRAATTLAAIEATALIVWVLVRSSGATPLLAAAVAMKYPFCLLARRLHPGGFLGLLLWEGVGALVALTSGGMSIVLRVVELGVSLTVIGLLVASAHLFPTPRLPDR